MQYLIGPENGIWVGVGPRLVQAPGLSGLETPINLASLMREKINAVETWFFDFDDNHAPSLAKILAMRAVGSSYFSADYLRWCKNTAWRLLTEGKAAETETWQAYVDLFLRSDDALLYIEKVLTPQVVRQSLFNGVEDFCDYVSAAQRIYVSRNIQQVISAYAQIHPFDDYYVEVTDKASRVEQFLLQHPHIERFGVEGDSQEDAEMIKVLRSHGKDVFGIYCQKSEKQKFNGHFDIAVSRDRRGLLALLNDCPQ